MKSIILRAIWITILVFPISVFLPAMMGSTALHQFSEETVGIFFAAISLAFFITYLISGTKNWGWLFPTTILASLAVVIRLGYHGFPSLFFPLLLGSAIPFYIAYALHRQQWKLLLPAWILTTLPVLSPLSELIHSDLLASLHIYAIALPFQLAYLLNRKLKWALFTAVLLGFMALVPLAGLGVHGFILIALTLLLIAVPFFIAFITEKDCWPPIISGVTFSMGVTAAIDIMHPQLETIPIDSIQNGLHTVLLPLCITVILFILWRLHVSIPLIWKELFSI